MDEANSVPTMDEANSVPTMGSSSNLFNMEVNQGVEDCFASNQPPPITESAPTIVTSQAQIGASDQLPSFPSQKKRKPTRKPSEFDILNRWRVNASEYPVLAAVARDVLAIPVSTVALEYTFSTRGRTMNSVRSSLSPAMVETLICTQNWLKSTSISLQVESTIEEMEFYETIELGISIFLD
ncbi:hypothetical protein GBA52_020422 [Prunus armeniaca]|nr:hypothetical protein GBA52_020422 [Prunus armeniaca]